ncbi:hypothetical protein BX600DRAFT_484462 [Xylariales sp. PMI_506]|nr:hypothetical protein BX600DRAFT_484462 [Xylariales sp. PMI_506]
MRIRVGTRDLLEYDARYRVLICLECKYAIQKSAVGSHLLRHKIYRGDRQRLLSSITGLAIAEPQDVQHPPARSLPVDGLPVIPGYSCTAAGCYSLYASTKRMRRHWSEIHGLSDPPESSARTTNLQTFFRGTKICYFEVASPRAAPRIPPAISREGFEQGDNSSSALTVPGRASEPRLNLDLETLRYFHHFVAETSGTLPFRGSHTSQRWRTEVVGNALHLSWLMFGLLAISASHIAALERSEEVARAHQLRSSQFYDEFSTGWKGARSASGGVEDTDIINMGAQIICIWRCWQWAIASPMTRLPDSMQPVPFQLQSFMMALQGCADPDIAFRSVTSRTDVFRDAAAGGGRLGSDVSLPDSVPSTLSERLYSLPFRLSEALGKPDNALDVIVTLSTIDALVGCYSLGYASDDSGATWLGMESWLERMSDRFHQMLLRQSPPALIVLAYWTPLVERAARHYWFLEGMAQKIIQHIAAELPDDVTIQGLIANLLN